jgi:hypothetical protein
MGPLFGEVLFLLVSEAAYTPEIRVHQGKITGKLMIRAVCHNLGRDLTVR